MATYPIQVADPIQVGIGERLRQVRNDLGWSLQDVAVKSAGRWNPVVVGSYERADRNPRASTVILLAELYGADPAWVLLGDAVAEARREAKRAAIRLAQTVRELSAVTDRLGVALYESREG
ncbi:MAG: helix-turn-helix domain-containing protein [Actinomycetes bacterium]